MTRISQRAVCVACAVLLGFAAAALPTQQQQQQQQPSEDGATAGGLGTVLWSVLDDCFGGDGDAAVCLKTRALTALDRALARPVVTLTDGVSIAARDGKSVSSDPRAERAGRAALDAAEGPERKNALLDDMLADRVDRLMSTRTVVLDAAAAGQEGRKKKDKQMQQALMMAGMMAAAVMGPMAFKIIALVAGKALLLSKLALVLSAIIALKKLVQPQSGGHESESVSHHYGRSMQPDAAAQDVAYAAQKPQIAQ